MSHNFTIFEGHSDFRRKTLTLNVRRDRIRPALRDHLRVTRLAPFEQPARQRTRCLYEKHTL